MEHNSIAERILRYSSIAYVVSLVLWHLTYWLTIDVSSEIYIHDELDWCTWFYVCTSLLSLPVIGAVMVLYVKKCWYLILPVWAFLALCWASSGVINYPMLLLPQIMVALLPAVAVFIGTLVLHKPLSYKLVKWPLRIWAGILLFAGAFYLFFAVSTTVNRLTMPYQLRAWHEQLHSQTWDAVVEEELVEPVPDSTLYDNDMVYDTIPY